MMQHPEEAGGSIAAGWRRGAWFTQRICVGCYCDIFSALLSGANCAMGAALSAYTHAGTATGKRDWSFFSGDTDRRLPGRQKNFSTRYMDHWIQGFRNCKTVPGEEKVLVPVTRKGSLKWYEWKEGIPLHWCCGEWPEGTGWKVFFILVALIKHSMKTGISVSMIMFIITATFTSCQKEVDTMYLGKAISGRQHLSC